MGEPSIKVEQQNNNSVFSFLRQLTTCCYRPRRCRYGPKGGRDCCRRAVQQSIGIIARWAHSSNPLLQQSIDGTDRQTDRQTDWHCTVTQTLPHYYASSVNKTKYEFHNMHKMSLNWLWWITFVYRKLSLTIYCTEKVISSPNGRRYC